MFSKFSFHQKDSVSREHWEGGTLKTSGLVPCLQGHAPPEEPQGSLPFGCCTESPLLHPLLLPFFTFFLSSSFDLRICILSPCIPSHPLSEKGVHPSVHTFLIAMFCPLSSTQLLLMWNKETTYL